MDTVREETCRCEYVLKWLDAHDKYFPPFDRPRSLSQTRSSQVAYIYGPLPYVVQNVNYVVKPPHRISPIRPIYR